MVSLLYVDGLRSLGGAADGGAHKCGLSAGRMDSAVVVDGTANTWPLRHGRCHSSGLPETAFQDTGSGSCLTQAWACKLEEHHFHCFLWSKAVTGSAQI